MSNNQGEWCMIRMKGGGVCERECMEDESLTLLRYNSYMKPLKGGILSVAKLTIRHKREI